MDHLLDQLFLSGSAIGSPIFTRISYFYMNKSKNLEMLFTVKTSLAKVHFIDAQVEYDTYCYIESVTATHKEMAVVHEIARGLLHDLGARM